MSFLNILKYISYLNPIPTSSKAQANAFKLMADAFSFYFNKNKYEVLALNGQVKEGAIQNNK